MDTEWFWEWAKYIGIVSGLFILLGIIIAYVRSRSIKFGDTSASRNFTLADIRNMHDRGELTDEEFNKLKQNLIVQMKANMEAERKSDDE